MHCYLLNIEAVGLKLLEKTLFLVFPIIYLWKLLTLKGWANLDPRCMVGRIYVGNHWTLLYTKYINCRPHVFKGVLRGFSHYVYGGAIDPRGMASWDPSRIYLWYH